MKSIFETILSNGGITFNIKNQKELSSGFAVSTGQEFEIIIKKENFSILDIENFMKTNMWFFNRHSKACLGAWEYQGNIFLDISVVYENKEAAISQAKKLGEIAIFDLNNFNEIIVNENRNIKTA